MAVVIATYQTIEEVARDAGPYPSELLEGCETGLVLFGAGFLGRNDGIHFEMAGMQRVVCVDSNIGRIEQMQKLYPSTWLFIARDVWRAVENFKPRQFDAVSVDNFTGGIEPRVLESLPLWCSLARKVVTVTISRHAIPRLGDVYKIPDGWTSVLFERSWKASWLVLTPCE